MYPGVELRLYRYVVVLAEELNFTRAALRLHVAQPSLSKQIRELEDYLGAQVFERTKREVRLTAAGEAFAAEARLTLLHADRAVDGARAANGQHKGPWSIGYSPLIDLRILSKVRQHLSLAHPAADVRLVSAYTSEQADGLMRGKLQAGLVILPLREEGLASEVLYQDALVLALPELHPLAAKTDIEITDLHELPLVSIPYLVAEVPVRNVPPAWWKRGSGRSSPADGPLLTGIHGRAARQPREPTEHHTHRV